jgi:LysM domain
MKFARLAPGLALALSLPTLLIAEEEAAPAAPAETVAAETLGPVGHDSQGRPGRIHVVQAGDTLWDISDAYLGTPWVWPSIWKDNTAQVENPHRIYPSERIWISPHEMRKITDAEAAEMLARAPIEEPVEEAMPAAMADPDGPEPVRSNGTYRYTEIQTTGFVTHEELEGAATIIGAPANRTMLTDHTPIEIGLGRSEVAVGDQLDIFRPAERVVDPSTGRDMGRVTIQLGWMEVTEVNEESATGVIRMSRREMLKGDHVMPRRMRDAEIPIGDRTNVEGIVAFTPDKRVQMGAGDVLYLNRGSSAGLIVGSPVEIYEVS